MDINDPTRSRAYGLWPKLWQYNRDFGLRYTYPHTGVTPHCLAPHLNVQIGPTTIVNPINSIVRFSTPLIANDTFKWRYKPVPLEGALMDVMLITASQYEAEDGWHFVMGAEYTDSSTLRIRALGGFDRLFIVAGEPSSLEPWTILQGWQMEPFIGPNENVAVRPVSEVHAWPEEPQFELLD